MNTFKQISLWVLFTICAVSVASAQMGAGSTLDAELARDFAQTWVDIPNLNDASGDAVSLRFAGMLALQSDDSLLPMPALLLTRIGQRGMREEKYLLRDVKVLQGNLPSKQWVFKQVQIGSRAAQGTLVLSRQRNRWIAELRVDKDEAVKN